MPETAHIFLDTNTALHFKRPDQINWRELTGMKDIILIAAPIFHRELEQQKVHNQSRRLRERAASYIKWLVEFLRDPALEMNNRARWHFIAVEPGIDFSACNLSPSMADDHLIASVIAYGTPDDAKLFVATADFGLEIKLRHRKIEPLLLPETCKLPDEPDPLDKEVVSLRQQVARQRSPALMLVTDAEGNRHPVTVPEQVVVPSAPSLESMRREYSLFSESRQSNTSDKFLVGYSSLQESFLKRMLLSPERVAKYNEEREVFLVSYKKYLEDLLVWEEQMALTTEVKLSLSNKKGTMPATNIDIILRFPTNLIVVDIDDLPPKPRQPEPPSKLGAFAHIFNNNRAAGMDYFSCYNFVAPKIDTSRSVKINTEKGEITYWLKSLKHGFLEELNVVYFCFPNREDVCNFCVEYEISAAELPKPIEEKLHFIKNHEKSKCHSIGI